MVVGAVAEPVCHFCRFRRHQRRDRSGFSGGCVKNEQGDEDNEEGRGSFHIYGGGAEVAVVGFNSSILPEDKYYINILL